MVTERAWEECEATIETAREFAEILEELLTRGGSVSAGALRLVSQHAVERMREAEAQISDLRASVRKGPRTRG